MQRGINGDGFRAALSGVHYSLVMCWSLLYRIGRSLLVAGWVVCGLGCTTSPGPTAPPIVLSHEDASELGVQRLVLDPNVSVLMVGGHHEVGRDEAFLAGWLPELARRGYRTLALEIPRSYQPLIDAYLKGEGQASTAHLLHMVFREDFPKLLDEAARLDLKVLCYESMATFSPWVSLTRRDRVAFDTIRREGIERNPGGKVVVFCGALHLRDEVWYSHLLQQQERCLGHYLAEHLGSELVRVDLSRLSGR